MPRITPLHWKVLECIFEKDGFVFDRETDTHRIYKKIGFNRPVVIPKYREVTIKLIQTNMRTAKMSRERFFELLKQC